MADREIPEAIDRTVDPVVEAYKRDVDRTLLRENLKLTPEQRVIKFEQFMRGFNELRGAARRKPATSDADGDT
ncbi:MAG: hypothetical protein DCC67_08760 [Planctomycetota bacterium]|nr:MAG: hypothetical protein DCC67_08760 [Planctomycetota bacterium]